MRPTYAICRVHSTGRMPPVFLATFTAEGATIVEFLTAAAILPVKDVALAIARYTQLGFKGRIYENAVPNGRPIYGFLKRDRIDLHFALPHPATVAAYDA